MDYLGGNIYAAETVALSTIFLIHTMKGILPHNIFTSSKSFLNVSEVQNMSNFKFV